MSIQESGRVLEIGATIYGVVTPVVEHAYVSFKRPYPYFVTETTISIVHERQGREIEYFFDTKWNLRPSWCFERREDAESKLKERYKEETGSEYRLAKPPFVSIVDETEAIAHMMEELSQRVARP